METKHPGYQELIGVSRVYPNMRLLVKKKPEMTEHPPKKVLEYFIRSRVIKIKQHI